MYDVLYSANEVFLCFSFLIYSTDTFLLQCIIYNVFHNVPSVVLLSEGRVFFLIIFDQCDRKENVTILEIVA